MRELCGRSVFFGKRMSRRFSVVGLGKLGGAPTTTKDRHTVVLSSTVLPGSTRHGLVPVLEQQSGKRAGAELGVCYSPEFIALGSVIRDFLNPDFLLIGEIDAQSGAHLEACYRYIVRSCVPFG